MDKNSKLAGEISGYTRKRTYLMHKIEDVMIKHLSELVPGFIETYHLTLSSLGSSVLAIVSGYLSNRNKYWFLGIAVALITHWLTDMLDGEIGRRRNTGLVKWGFYADHFLDLIFVSSVFIGYALAFPDLFLVHIIIIIGIALFFVDSLLYALVGEEYSTSGFVGWFGPSEGTMVLVLFSILVIYLPEMWVKNTLLIIAISVLSAVLAQFYKHQKEFWEEELGGKKKK